MSQLIYDIMPEGWDRAEEIEPVPPLYDCGYAPGIYFGMPDTDYFKIPALSASGIKCLNVSTIDFWAQSWMNADYQDERTTAKELGTGYHVRILEGREAFYAKFAPAFDKSDYPNALDTVEDLKAALKSLDLKTTGNKPDLILRLLDEKPGTQILEVIKHDYYERHAGMEFLTPPQIREIEIAAAMIEGDPVLSKCFTGGFPEVTVIWYDAETGVPMKSRIDYLKLNAIIDLKSFSNPLGKPIDKAIYNTMASRKYHVQASTYIEADIQAMKAAAEGRVWFAGVEVEKAWLEKYTKVTDRKFVFVFQQTGIAPLARGKIFPRNLVYECGVIAMRDAMRKFAECFRKFGTDPWIDTAPMEYLTDEEFPNWTTE